MADLNSVLLMGHLTKDIEIRYTPKGNAVADIRLAVNHTYKSHEGDLKEEVCFVDIVVWGRQAENCAQYLSKGRNVCVEGRLVQEQWETTEGEKRTRLKVRADRVVFLPNGKPSDGAAGRPVSQHSQHGYDSHTPAAPSSAQRPSQSGGYQRQSDPLPMQDHDADDMPF